MKKTVKTNKIVEIVENFDLMMKSVKVITQRYKCLPCLP